LATVSFDDGADASLPRKVPLAKKNARVPPAASPTGRPTSTRSVAFGS
jgi:hypothetical protein